VIFPRQSAAADPRDRNARWPVCSHVHTQRPRRTTVQRPIGGEGSPQTAESCWSKCSRVSLLWC